MNEQKAQWAVTGGWTGRGTLTELVAELDRQKAAKVDFVADTRNLEVRPKGGTLVLTPTDCRAAEWLGKEGLPIRRLALAQLGSKQEPEIPSMFLERLAELRPNRAADLVNGLMQDGPARRFIRCMDGSVRAILSDRFRVLDHYDLAYAAMDAVRANGGEVVEAALSETHMRIKFTSRQVWEALDVKRQGDRGGWYAGGLGNQKYLSKVAARSGGELPGGPGTVHPLVTISNSETGHGGYGVRVGILQAICFNLATVEEVVAKVHLGERMEVGIFSQATLNQESKTIYMKSRDAVVSAFKPEVFNKMVDICRAAQDREIKAPQSAVENIAKVGALSEPAREAVLSYFLRDYDMNAYGLAQAVARYAQDEPGGEAAAAAEDLAGRILVGAVGA